jgi:hypothetical protein
MNKIIKVTATVSVIFFAALSAQAQKSKTKTSTTTSVTKGIDTSTHAPKTKIEKMAADADSYTKVAEDTKNKIKILFPSKAGDTVYFVIAGISYIDPNLKLLKQKLGEVKNTKGLTSGYKNNTAVVKIIYKGGDASNLYDKLSDDLKEMFMADDMEGNRAILLYKLANQIETSGNKKATAASNK